MKAAIQDLGPLAMVMLALGIVSVLALRGHEAAAGALIGTVSAGVGFYLRGRVQQPS